MKIDQIERVVCHLTLRPGQVKRVPLEATRRCLGYYVACPRCGAVNVVSATSVEIGERDARLWSLDVPCDGTCGHQLIVREGAFAL